MGGFVAAIAVVSAPPVFAQSATTDAVYQDVKTVIEDLLTTEVSHTVATRTACLAGRREAKSDTPNAVNISQDLSGGTAGGPSDKYVSLEALGVFPDTLQAIYNERYSSLKPVLLREMSSFVGDLAYQLLRPREVAPAATPAARSSVGSTSASQTVLVGLMEARAALLDHGRHAHRAPDAAEAAPKLVYTPLSDEELDNCSANLGYMISTKQIAVNGSPLDHDCSLDEKTRDEYSCDVAFAIRDSLMAAPAQAESYVVRALTVFADELMGASSPTQAQIAATMMIVNQMVSSSDGTAAAVEAALKELSEALGVSAPASAKLPLTELVDQWKAYRLSDGRPLSAARLADIAGEISALVVDDCATGTTPKACDFFKREKEILGAYSDLWPIVRLAGSGDYVDSAQLAIGILFRGIRKSCAAKSQQEQGGCQVAPFIERFADDIVVYVVQDHVSGTPSDEARSALRAATEDLVQELSLNGGIDRPFLSAKMVWLPDLALRYDWSPSFGIDGSSAARTVASVPWLKFRAQFARTRVAYSALSFSIFDLVAPLAELANRSTGLSLDHEGRIWRNIVAPRIDIDGGIPVLSKHLLVGAGITYRMVAPSMTAAATATAPAQYEYRSCLRSSGWQECFQFGVFAKYTI